MDRTTLTACAIVLVSVIVNAGCERQPEAQTEYSAPLVLAELQQASPGPWRHVASAPVSVTSLERSNDSFRPSGVPTSEAIETLRERRRHAFEGPHWAPEDVAVEQDSPAEEALADEPAVRFADPPGDKVDDASREALRLPAAGPIEAARDHTGGAPAAVGDSAIHEPRKLDGLSAKPATDESPAFAVPPESAERSALPWAGSPRHSAQMRPVVDEAQQRIREGFRLAQRNALFLARAEFIAALELIAEANDMQQGTQFYTDSLAAGLTALAESRDFVRSRPVGKPLDMPRIVAGHKTPVLKDSMSQRIPPAMAAKRYYVFAQEQLAAAAATEVCGSTALFGLGKLMLVGEKQPASRLELTAQAMVLFQSALMADPGNYRAANELAVILARGGDFTRARELLVHSVRLSPQPATFRNLAVVHTKLGEPNLAASANRRAVALEAAGHTRSGPAVQWLDPATFAGMAPPSDSILPPVATPAGESQREPGVSTARKGADWLPWNPRR